VKLRGGGGGGWVVITSAADVRWKHDAGGAVWETAGLLMLLTTASL